MLAVVGMAEVEVMVVPMTAVVQTVEEDVAAEVEVVAS